MAERTRRAPLWVRVAFPLVVLGGALGIGSGVLDAQPPTASQRAAAIEAGVRCPSCTDLSVAQSNATTAIAVRHQIEQLVSEGRSADDIEQVLVSEYGQTILLIPPDAGGIPIIWVVPLVLGAVVLGAVGVLFWRRTRDFDALRVQVSAAGTPGAADQTSGEPHSARHGEAAS